MADLLNLQDLTVSDAPAPVEAVGTPEPSEVKGEEFALIPMDSPVAVQDIPTPAVSNDHAKIDLTLLRGLEPAMSHEEQAKLTALMTSGNPGDLAAAAKVFYELGAMLKAGVFSPAKRSDYQQLALEDSFVSIPSTSASAKIKNRPAFNDREERVADEKKVQDVDNAERAHALPLPVRMPRYVVLSAFDALEGKKKPLAFLDDPWDGTLGSAFTKLEVHRDNNSKGLRKLLPSKKPKGNSHCDHDIQFSPGFDLIVDRIEGGYSARLIEGLDGDDVNRVLVATVAHEACKLGVARGDVVTHVNGKEFNGKAEDLANLVSDHFRQNPEAQLELVLNAEICVAQALKLRAQD